VLTVMMASMAKTMGMGARMVLAHGISPYHENGSVPGTELPLVP